MTETVPAQPPRLGITGATGFLGTHTVAAARAAGFDIVPLGRSGPAATRAWDATDSAAAMSAALEGLDCVCHLAAHVPRDMRDPAEAERCLRVNALGSLDLARACRAAGVRRLVLASAGNISSPRDRPVREDDPIADVHVHAPYYLGSKAVGEAFVRAQAGPELDVVVVRPSAIYGAGMRDNVISAFSQRLARGEAVTVNDGGRYRADFVEAGDVARVIVAAAASDRSGIVNVGSGVATSLRELAGILCGLLCADEALIRVSGEAAGPATGFPALDITRAAEWFDFRPTPLEDGLRRYLRAAGLARA